MPKNVRTSPHQRALLVSATTALLLSLALGTSAQEGARGPSAEEVAAIVQGFYDRTQTLQADFRQTQYTRIYDRTTRARGRVVFKKPGKMRFDYAEPNGQVFVSDGERLLVYQPPDEGEDRGQLIERPLSEDQLPSVFGFLTGTGRLDEDFTFRLLAGDSGDARGYDGHVLELRPRSPTPHYERVLFYVNIVGEGARRAGVVQRVLIVDSQGNRNRFDFSNLRFNRNVPDSRFNYTPPAGTPRVEP